MSNKLADAQILIVDDNDDVRYQLTRRLARLGYDQVTTAETGREALDLIANRSFDLVLLDIMMPGMSGHEVLDRLAAGGLLATLPVIVVSALDDFEAAVQCIRAGAEDYLTKPVNSVLLEARVNSALSKKRLRDETAQQLKIIRGVFGRYVPDSVVEQIVAGKGELEPAKSPATIMFTDIEGFTRIVESLEPERGLQMLNEYFDAVIEPVISNGGTVNQFQGDAMMVTFNVPVPDPQHADHALAAARRIIDIQHQRRFADVALRTRIGLNTGMVIAGNVGSGDRVSYTVHGDAVNVAARLEQLNKELGTELLISGSTRALLSDPSCLEDLGPAPIRGRSDTVEVYRLIGDGPD